MSTARRRSWLAQGSLILLLGACADPGIPVAGPPSDPDLARGTQTSDPTVTSTSPAEALRGTTLDVEVNGSGFDKGTTVRLVLDGEIQATVRVNTTRYVRAGRLVANITIDADAPADRYDVVVLTGSGKTGIGTEMFEVTMQAEALVDGRLAYGVNESGDIVGSRLSDTPCTSETQPMLWRADGSPVRLPLAGYCGGTARGINSSGLIIGWGFGGAPNAGVMWRPSGASHLQEDPGVTAGGDYPVAFGAINDSAVMVGWTHPAGKLYWWSASTGWLPMQMPSGATLCQSYNGINNRGEIVASCTVDGVKNGYYWSHHAAEPLLLPRPGAGDGVVARDLNDSGVVVGYVSGSTTRALRWVPAESGYTTVEVLPDAGTGATAYAIARDGTIAGALRNSGGNRPVIWRPGRGWQSLGSVRGASVGSGEALDVAVTDAGLVVIGEESNTPVRWREAP